MGRPLRVAMLMRQFHPRAGGYQNQALRLARELASHDVEVLVVTQTHGVLEPYEELDGIRIFRVSTLSSGYLASFSFLLAALVRMWRLRSEFDVIHAHRSSSGLIAGIIGRVLGKRTLYKLTRGDEIDRKGFDRGLWGRSKLFVLDRTVDRFVAITARIEADLRALGIAPEKIVRIPNGIGPLDPRNRAEARSTLGLPEAPCALFVGRLVPAKGVDWLLESWRDVVAKVPEARLFIVGDGAERGALEGLASSLGVSSSVTFTGRIPDPFVHMAAADVFVLPSRKEGMANSLMEAMASGAAIVAGDDVLGGNRELIEDGQEGALVPREDRSALARTLLELFAAPEKRKRFGDAARRKVEDRFSIRSVAGAYAGLYRELLAREAATR